MEPNTDKDSRTEKSFEVVTSNRKKKTIFKKIPKKTLLIVIGTLTALGIAAAAVVILVFSDDKDANTTTTCVAKTSSELLTEAAKGITPLDFLVLRPVIEKIKKLDCYDNNVNYVYVLLQYSLSTSDSVNSKLYLEKLKTLKTDSVQYATALGATTDIASLEVQVKGTESASGAVTDFLEGVPSL